MADEPDTRSSPGAGQRYEDNPPDCTSTLGNPIKNNGYERSASANDEMGERLSNDQGAEGELNLTHLRLMIRTKSPLIFLQGETLEAT